MPPGLEQFSRIVETLYEAGLDSERWQDVCDGLSAILPGIRIMMQGHDLRARSNLGLISSNYDPRDVAAYQQYYAGINVWLPLIGTVPVGKVLIDSDVLERRDLVNTEFWADFVRPLGDISAAVGTVMFRDADRLLVLTGNFNWARRDSYMDDARHFWSLLTPHAQRAFAIQRTLESQRLIDRSYRQALDKVRNAVFLLDGNGRISHCNEAAQVRLRDGDTLFVDPGKRLRAFDPQADGTIRAQAAAIAARRYAGLAGAIAVGPRSGGRPLVATLVPFRPNETDTGMFSDFIRAELPVAMLTLIDPERREARLRAALSAIYRLTPSETDVAVSLHCGQSLSDCAAARGVSIHTVRNQLRSILEKTGTHRQSELVALMNTLA